VGRPSKQTDFFRGLVIFGMTRDKEGRKARPVQVHIPYPVLIERFEDVLGRSINPEVYLDSEHLDNADREDLEYIASAFSARGLTITLHGPYANLNPGAAEEDKRLLTVERYGKAFEAAAYLRPKVIVLHAGYNEKKFRGDASLWLAQSLKTWPAFVKEAGRLDVVIAAENIFEKTPDTLKTLVERVASPWFRVCIDSGHLNVFSGVPMEEWFKALGGHIAEVHLHDNGGREDEHLPLGEGSIDFALFFRLLREYSADPVYTIEPHGEEMMRRGLKAIRKYL
jgi:sugar phosphate isomerase/epimerase